MSTTAMAWLAAFGIGCFAALSRPFVAMVLYLLEYYEHPPLRWWGNHLPDLRWSLITSAVLLIANLGKWRNPFSSEVTGNPPTRWLYLFLVVAAFVTPFAVSVNLSLHYLADIAKLTLLYSLIILSVRTRTQFRIFLLVMIVGGFLWGFDAWLDPHRTGGRLRSIGGPDSFNDNSAAAHLLPLLPIIPVFLWKAKTWWWRVACLVASPFIVNTIILCNSRGATVAVGVMGVAALVLARGRVRLLVLAIAVAGGVAAAFLVDRPFIERQLTTADYEEDGSAMGRIDAWKGALHLMADHPWGTGGGGFDVLSPIYIPLIVEAHGGEERAVHNTYLWVGSDWGFVGLFFFMMFIFTTLRELHRLGRRSRDELLYLECFTLQIGFIGFLVAAFFINRPYAEMLYWIAGLTGALRNIQRREAETAVTAATREAAPREALAPGSIPSMAPQT
jgi:probable O-glycosylation ligase (exosortase A-associated)